MPKMTIDGVEIEVPAGSPASVRVTRQRVLER